MSKALEQMIEDQRQHDISEQESHEEYESDMFSCDCGDEWELGIEDSLDERYPETAEQ
jgi:hypothetical protein